MRNILIYTYEIPNNRHAGSMQLLRVFQGYPADKLLVLGPKPPAEARLLDCPYRQIPFPIQRWRNTRFHRWAMSLPILLPSSRPSPLAARQLLKDFRPEAVFTVMDNFSWYSTARDFASKRALPLITITMDAPDRFEKNLGFLEASKQRQIGEIYQGAERNLCVSRQMTDFIAKKYHAPTETFYFGPPDGLAPRLPDESSKLRKDGGLTLGFAGGLAYGYGEALLSIAKKLVGTKSRIRIYSRDRPSTELAKMVDYAGSFSHEVLWKKFQEECDASLLVYAFDHADDDLYRTHFPTKLSEYAWQGMPMVMVGPAHATGILWGLDHPEACLVETDKKLDGLREKLGLLAGDPLKRKNMAEAALRFAQQEFDPVKIKSRFHQILASRN